MRLTASVIIPTYNRPQEIRDCLMSLLRQTVKPDEIVVVDDGNLPEPPLKAEIERAGLSYTYVKNDKSGRVDPLNVGVSCAGGDIVYFLDDDVELYPDYLERIRAHYTADPEGQLAGVGGVIANARPMTVARTVRWVANTLVLNSGFREGAILPSGFCVDYGYTPFPPVKPRDVQFLSGGASSYRRHLLAERPLVDGYRAIAYGEDKLFSGGLARRHRLVLEPGAKLIHHESPAMRADNRARGRKTVLGKYLLFRGVAKRHGWHWLCFAYALTGYLLIRTAIAVARCRRADGHHVLGALDAAWLIVRGRVTLTISGPSINGTSGNRVALSPTA